jgi:hypothetical protein
MKADVMDIIAGLVLISLVAVFAALVVSPRTAQSLDTFAAGFLPYRGAGWPRGVQEEDPVPWSWSTPRGPDDAEVGIGGPKVVDIDGLDAPAPSPVRRGPTVQRMAGHRALAHAAGPPPSKVSGPRWPASPRPKRACGCRP